MNVLSIQSHVTYGHVGNAAAVFPLQRLGHDVWAINTVGFSNHLGYPTWRGRTHTPAEVKEILDGLELLGALKRCDAILSGYLGDKGNSEVVLEAIARVRTANPDAPYACDPVMGDRGSGLFVKPDIPAAFTDLLLPAADIAFPNAFELEYLTGGATDRLASALEAADALRSRMRRGAVVVLTSLLRTDGPPGRIEVLAVSDTDAWLIDSPYFSGPPHGAGDCFAALFLGHYLKTRSIEAALGRAVTGIHGVLAASVNSEELRIIAAQDHLDPREPAFIPRRVR
jgi:pyridoxine kinase